MPWSARAPVHRARRLRSRLPSCGASPACRPSPASASSLPSLSPTRRGPSPRATCGIERQRRVIARGFEQPCETRGIHASDHTRCATILDGLAAGMSVPVGGPLRPGVMVAVMPSVPAGRRRKGERSLEKPASERTLHYPAARLTVGAQSPPATRCIAHLDARRCSTRSSARLSGFLGYCATSFLASRSPATVPRPMRCGAGHAPFVALFSGPSLPEGPPTKHVLADGAGPGPIPGAAADAGSAASPAFTFCAWAVGG